MAGFLIETEGVQTESSIEAIFDSLNEKNLLKRNHILLLVEKLKIAGELDEDEEFRILNALTSDGLRMVEA